MSVNCQISLAGGTCKNKQVVVVVVVLIVVDHTHTQSTHGLHVTWDNINTAKTANDNDDKLTVASMTVVSATNRYAAISGVYVPEQLGQYTCSQWHAKKRCTNCMHLLSCLMMQLSICLTLDGQCQTNS